MKKITFILLALISGTALAQNSADGTADVLAHIVSPISISETGSALDFGKIAKDNAGGTVIVDVNGARTGTAAVIGENETTAASFTVNAADTYAYTISFSENVTLTSGENTMLVDSFTHNLGANPTGNGSEQTLNIGATLNVGVDQNEGEYDGEVTVTVAYE